VKESDWKAGHPGAPGRMRPQSILVLLFSAIGILFFCFVLFADFIPAFFGAYADQRLVLSMSLITLIVLALIWLSFQRKLASTLPDLWPFTLLVFSFFLAALQYHSGAFYLVEPVFYALYFLAFGITSYVIRAEGVARIASQALMMVAAVACFFYAAMTITVYLFAITDDFFQLDNIIPWGFVNIRYWSHIATWVVPLFPLCLLIAPCKDNKLWRLGVVFAAAIWWWILFMSSSRGSMVGLFIGFILVWACFGRIALPWVKLFVRFAVYGLVAWLVLSVVIPSLVFDNIQIRGITGDSSGRMPLWQEAWTMSLQNFPFGMGPQAWLTHDILTEAYRDSKKFGHPHNMYLMWAAEYGWVSIAGLIVLCGVALARLFRQVSAVKAGLNDNGLYLIAVTASVIAALVHAGVSAVFIAPGSMLIGLLVLTVFWALIQPDHSAPAAAMAFKRQRFSRLAGFALVILFLVASLVWFREVLRYRQAMANDVTYYQENVSLGHLPRFWFHGYFPRQSKLMPDVKSSLENKN